MPDRKIIIKIPDDSNLDASNERANQATGRNAKAGPHISQRENDFLPRRNSSGFINFWDLGQIKDGENWDDLVFSVPLVYSSGDFNHEPLGIAEYGALRDLILSPDISTFESKYRKLTYSEAELYGLDIYATSRQYSVARNGSRLDGDGNIVSDTQWSEKGLNISASDLAGPLTFISYGAFMNWQTDSFLKFTNEPSYAAPGVTFTLAKNANVFLMPRLENIYASSSTLSNTDYIAFPYQALKRNFWLQRKYQPISGHEYPLYSNDGISNTELTDPDKVSLLESLRSTGIEWDDISGTHGSPSLFPLYPDNVTLWIEHVGASVVPLPNWPSGTLMAIVKQCSSVFYVWNDFYGGIITNGRDIDLSGLY